VKKRARSWCRLGFDLRRQFPRRQIVLRGNSKCVRDAIEKREHRSDIDGFRNLIFQPACITEFLHIFRSRAIRGLRDQFHVVEQDALRRRQARFVELAFENRCNTFIRSSLNTQEVSVTVQSIRTPVQVGNMAGNHFLGTTRKMAFGKMNGVGELDNLAEKIGPRSEALDDTRNLLAP